MKKILLILLLLLHTSVCYSQTIIDNFNRSNRALTSDGWGLVEGTCEIIDNTMGGTTAAHENLCYTPNSYNANMAAFITITTKPADYEGLSFFVRYNSSTFSGYDIQFTTQAGYGTDRFRLFRFDSGSFGPQLGSTYTTEVQVGDKFGIVANGNNLRCYYLPVNTNQWITIINVTDSTYTSGGRIAFGAYGNVGRYDNLIGGNDLNLPVTPIFESNFNSDNNWTPDPQTTYSMQFCYSACNFLIGWTAYNQAPSQCLPGITNQPGVNSIYVNSVAGFPKESTSCKGGTGKCATKWQEACDSGDAFDDSDANLGKDLGAEYDDLYFQFSVKFPPSFTFSNDGQAMKLFHVQHYNPSGCTPAGNPWSYFDYCAPDDFNKPVTAGGFRSYENSIDFYLEARGYSETYAHGFVFWRLSTLAVARANGGVADGNWHTVEMHIVNNSAIGVSDGYIDLWIDGVQQTEFPGYEATGIDWNNTLDGPNTDKRGFRFVSIFGNNTKWTTACTDGSGDMSECEQWYAIDDVVVSTTYIGNNYVIADQGAPSSIVTCTIDTTNNQTVSNPSFIISGTASTTNGTITSVTSTGLTISGTTSWSTTATLSSGLNTFNITATDSNNNSDTKTINVTYNPPAQASNALLNGNFMGILFQ